MKIKLEEKNITSINALILEKAGRMECYPMITPETIKKLDKNVELLTKKEAIGTKLILNGFSGSLPKAYKYKKAFMSCTFEFCPSGWFLTGVNSDFCYSGGSVDEIDVYHTTEQKVIIKNKLYRQFYGN
jgi:hypothetical protein